MAIWQFTFTIIPCKKEIKSADDIRSWNGYSLKDSSIKEISKVLKPSKSWSDDIKVFGNNEETCIELFYENNILDDVSVRLDLRNLTIEILEAIVNFINSNDAFILTTNGATVKPIVKDLIEQIRKSEAYSFSRNPETFLAQIKEKNQ